LLQVVAVAESVLMVAVDRLVALVELVLVMAALNIQIQQIQLRLVQVAVERLGKTLLAETAQMAMLVSL
jgi:hypothetical protein